VAKCWGKDADADTCAFAEDVDTGADESSLGFENGRVTPEGSSPYDSTTTPLVLTRPVLVGQMLATLTAAGSQNQVD
jgi:hypothetical protein